MIVMSSADPPFAYSTPAKNMFSMSFLPSYEDRNNPIANNDEHALIFPAGLNMPEYNTWDTWRLIPTSVPIVAAPQVTSSFTELNNKDGSLDETNVLHPHTNTHYRQICSGNFEFYLDFEYSDKFNNFYIFYTHLLETLHGKKKIMVLNEDPVHMYIGRFFIESLDDSADGNNQTISMSYNIEPFLYFTEGLSSYYTSGQTDAWQDRYGDDY